MGTRSAVATMIDGAVKGRYVHWDGYPTGVGVALQHLVNRDGVEKVTQVVMRDHYGWSSLNGAEEQTLDQGYTDGRFAAVPGYGVAYTTEQGQSAEDQWVIDGDESWCEWAYVLTESGIVVCTVSGEKSTWLPFALVRYDSEDGMQVAEKMVADSYEEETVLKPLPMPAFPTSALSA